MASGPIGAIEAFTIDGYSDDRYTPGGGHALTGKILGGVLLGGAAIGALMGLMKKKEAAPMYRPSYFGGLAGRKLRKGWRTRMPRSGLQRRELEEKCGTKAFLDPKGRKYPVMGKSCSFDCQGILSAYRRARQQASMSKNAGLTKDAAYHNRMASKAKKLGMRLSCPVKAWQRAG